MNLLPHYDWLGRWLAPGMGDNGAASMPYEDMWPALLRLAGGQFVTPLVYCSLRDRGLLDQVPDEPRQYLADIHALNRARNLEIRQQIVEFMALFNQAGISPLFLKGAASLLSDLYGDPGARVLGDIDLFLRQAELPVAVRLLNELGYRSQKPDNWISDDRHAHLQPLIHPHRRASIELHWRTFSSARARRLLTEAILYKQSTTLEIEQGSVQLRMPSQRARLLHVFLHSQVRDKAFLCGDLHLRQLSEFVWLCGAGPEIELELSGLCEEPVYRNAWQAWRLAAERWLGLPYPDKRTASFTARLWLQRVQLQMRHPLLNRLQRRFLLRLRKLLPRPLRPMFGVGIPG